MSAWWMRSGTGNRYRETVLVVDDDSGVRSFVRTVLERNGYDVLEAGNGAEAVERAHNAGWAIDVLITDVRMPVFNGPALAERLLGQDPHLPVLFTSWFVGQEMDVGSGRNVLMKPFSPNALLSAVHSMLKHRIRGAA